jgi:hypothetical protein
MPLLQYKISSKSTNRFKRCILLRSLNVRYFEMVEVTALNNRQSKSSSMSSSPYKMSSKSTNQFKSCAHLISLNFCHFETLKLWDLIVWSQGRLQCHNHIQNFIQIHQTVQKLLRCFFTPTSDV